MANSRTKLWFALFVVAVFGLGVAAGLFLGVRLDRGNALEWTRGPRTGVGPGGPRGGPGVPRPEILLERLSRDLDLTVEQRTELGSVLRASRLRVEQLQRDVRGRFGEEQATLHAEIRQLLTPEQQARFEKIAERGRGGRGAGRGRGSDR